MNSPRFSLPRALRLLSISLEIAILVGLAVKSVLLIIWLQPHHEFMRRSVDIACDFVVLSICVFLLVTICLLSVGWRSVLFRMIRAVLYYGILGLTGMPLGSSSAG